MNVRVLGSIFVLKTASTGLLIRTPRWFGAGDWVVTVGGVGLTPAVVMTTSTQ